MAHIEVNSRAGMILCEINNQEVMNMPILLRFHLNAFITEQSDLLIRVKICAYNNLVECLTFESSSISRAQLNHKRRGDREHNIPIVDDAVPLCTDIFVLVTYNAVAFSNQEICHTNAYLQFC